MNPTPTPRTDDLKRELEDSALNIETACEHLLDHARQLERELAELQDRVDDSGLHSCHAECKRPNCVLRRQLAKSQKAVARLAEVVKSRDADRVYLDQKWNELRDQRDNAISDFKQADADSIRALYERNEARKQRDALAKSMEIVEDCLRNGWPPDDRQIAMIRGEHLSTLNPP